MECLTCRFYASGNGKDVTQGICRYRPPVAHLISSGPGNPPGTLSVWPAVKNQTDWCGMWEGVLEVMN